MIECAASPVQLTLESLGSHFHQGTQNEQRQFWSFQGNERRKSVVRERVIKKYMKVNEVKIISVRTGRRQAWHPIITFRKWSQPSTQEETWLEEKIGNYPKQNILFHLKLTHSFKTLILLHYRYTSQPHQGNPFKLLEDQPKTYHHIKGKIKGHWWKWS